ncbi:UDP-glucuronic acid decarboxylase 4 [Linum perenne]
MDYHRGAAIEVRIARIFNTYGPRMCIDDGRVVSNFVAQALRKEPILDGFPLPLPSLTENRVPIPFSLHLLLLSSCCNLITTAESHRRDRNREPRRPFPPRSISRGRRRNLWRR